MDGQWHNHADEYAGKLYEGLGRMISGESLFMVTYTATALIRDCNRQRISGHIVAVDVSKCPIIAQKRSCAQPSVTLSAYVTRGLKAGFFGGEGFIMQRLSGTGIVFLK